MDFSEVVFSRRAIRKYKNTPVSDEILHRLFQAIQVAPSANNRQPLKFVFVRKEEIRQKIVTQACNQDFLYEAPVLAMVCCEKGSSFDAAIAMEHLVLAAANEGLSSCIVAWFDKDTAGKIIQIPDTFEIPILVALGYADESPEAKIRKTLDELISFDTFQNTGK